MKHLKTLNKYFWKHRTRFVFGILFIILSNYFAILAPQLTGHIFDMLQRELGDRVSSKQGAYDPLVYFVINRMGSYELTFAGQIATFSILILVFSLLRGFFMFLMRQTIIVM